MSAEVFEGGCYCGKVRYRAVAQPLMKAECFCRQCQYVTGGASELIMAVPSEGFELTGTTKRFTHPDWPNAVLVGAGSGHGFKHGPEVGRYAAQLALGTLGEREPRFSLASKGTAQDRSVH